MAHTINSLNQPIGLSLTGWKPPSVPAREPMEGHFCRVEPLDVKRHAAGLFAANALDVDGRIWTYLSYGPFQSLESYRDWIEADCLGGDPLFFAIVEQRTARAVGVASYLRITPASGSIEVGHINYSPLLSLTPAGTEAMVLMMNRVFDLGYRRYEWKCDALNEPSRKAAARLGFSFEGVFRQATIYKGRNRDTAWFAIIDHEWPALKAAYETWLDPGNFDAHGKQQQSLGALTAAALGVKP
jgi:RimJ/RimL family protein N-acetyltransferase